MSGSDTPRLAIVIDKLFADHDNGMGHPESQERILAIADMLRETKLLDELPNLEPRDATKDEITLVHDPEYYDKIASTRGKPRVFLDADTSTCPVSFNAALRAAGGVLQSIDFILDGLIDMSFPLVRPPGHHAERDRAMGFCLFNNVAVGASYLINKKGKERVLVVDWDIHHGNGTQNMFYDSPQVLYFSTHQYPYYPGTGGPGEVGADKGKGYNVNVPLQPGMGDREYVKIFTDILLPVIDQYRPEFLLVSAGFDTYYEDPLGGMKVTPEGFAMQARILKEQAEKYCDGNIIYLLEGGYNLEGLWLSVKEVIEELLGKKTTTYDIGIESTLADGVIDNVKKEYAQYWEF